MSAIGAWLAAILKVILVDLAKYGFSALLSYFKRKMEKKKNVEAAKDVENAKSPEDISSTIDQLP